jgi:phosphoenolpyruvate-protein phosphotransferase (PTS system enzyme I)
MTIALSGVGASKGIAIGELSIVSRGQLEVLEYTVDASAIPHEVARFERAVEQAREMIRKLRDQIPADTPDEVAEFMNVHLLMLQDSAITKVPVNLITEKRCNAEWALKIQRDAVMDVFEAMDDPYLRTRKDDVDHVVSQIQRILSGDGEPVAGESEPDATRLTNRIVFAEDLTPADAVLMQKHGILAFLTEYGGATSHTAILARSLGIPAVVGLHNARAYLREDEPIIVDGREGVVLVQPDLRMRRHYEGRQRDITRHRVQRRRLRSAPVVTRDGQRIGLQANVELGMDIETARAMNADGIGLYRTESLYMNRRMPPDEEEQFEAYAGVVQAMRGAPVTIRTVDLGADKQVDGVRPGAPASSNPALGLRAVRLCLHEPNLFRPQLRAILRASALGPLRMMVPMLSNIHEVEQVRHFVAEAREELDRRGQPHDPAMPFGAMIEVPAAALCADAFARELDFLSIGTNDLIQYTIAIDRVDDEVNYLYDPVHPAVLRLIRMTIRAGHNADVPVAMCGEMAGDARYTRLLLGMGLREFSVHPNAILEIKQIITESHVGQLRKLSQRVLATTKAPARLALIEAINAQA